ncbi:MAG: Dyp-type peroxidase [Idiomarina sp.]|nr:Dyp-type peroxidase [Idiomarina sp.]
MNRPQRPQEGICAEPSIHAWVLLLDVVSDDVETLRERLSRFPQFTDGLAGRFSESQLSCVVAIGEPYWDILASQRPRELQPMPSLPHSEYSFPDKPADIALIFRADRMDANYFAGRVMLEWLGELVSLNEEIHGFRYLDGRDLFGFRLDPEMPHGTKRREMAWIDAGDDTDFAGGSYLWLQRYQVDLRRWEKLSVEAQRDIMGREKVSGKRWPVDRPTHADKTSIPLFSDDALALWRVQMPEASMQHSGELGLHWSRSLQDLTRFMTQRFVADEDGFADPLLDYATVSRNGVFFAPSRTWLEQLHID